MDDLYCFFSISAVNQDRNLNFTGGDHININPGIIKGFKQARCYSRIVDHSGSHNRNLGHICIGFKTLKADLLLMLL